MYITQTTINTIDTFLSEMTSNLGIISDPEPQKKEHVYKNITVQILHNKYIFWNETTCI